MELKTLAMRCAGRAAAILAGAVAIAAACPLSASGATTITVDSATQRWPWNNKVDITYTVTDGQDLVASNFYKIVFTTVIDGTTYTIDGVTNVGASANSGTHTVTWTAPSGVRCTNCTMTAALYTSDAPSGNDYMIINLQTGAVRWEGILATQEESNRRYNVDGTAGTATAFKRTQMVLRKIPAGGTYPTGCSSNFTGAANYTVVNSPKTWKTDRDFYAGIFPVTRLQYQTLGVTDRSVNTETLNANATSANAKSTRPVETVSWNDLRGEGVAPTNSLGAKADGTFFERLNFIVGNASGISGFDLPTEVMSEIVERAGSTALYYWGDVMDIAYVACKENCMFVKSGTSTEVNSTVSVGNRLPNAWGFYDTCGNVWEWCLDDRSKTNLANADGVFNPACDASSSDGEKRVYRGGGCYYNENPTTNERFHASYRNAVTPDKRQTHTGFRVYWVAD